MLFGSCRTSVPHDMMHTISHGWTCCGPTAATCARADGEWPDLLLLLGDQVYADEPSRRDAGVHRTPARDSEPKNEIADFEEYAELYRQAWTDPEIRWLLSTVPTCDDLRRPRPARRLEHLAMPGASRWRDVPWWQRRVVAGLGAYWIYQHLGNLSPAERAGRAAAARAAVGGGDGADALDAFAARADADPTATGGATPATSATPG